MTVVFFYEYISDVFVLYI